MSQVQTVRWKNTHGGSFIHTVRFHHNDLTSCGKNIPDTADRFQLSELRSNCAECDRKNHKAWKLASYRKSYCKVTISQSEIDEALNAFRRKGGMIEMVSPGLTPIRNDVIYSKLLISIDSTSSFSDEMEI